MFFLIIIGISIVIIVVATEQNDASGLFVTKERNGIIRPLLQIAETDNITESFDGIQDAVGAGVCLNKAVHLQVLIHP